MNDIFIAIFLFSPILLLIGLIRPQLFRKIPMGNISRPKIAGFSIAVAFFSFIGFALTSDSTTTPKQALGDKTEVSSYEVEGSHAVIKRVIDGDTVETESGLKIRYIGIDTPETVYPSKPVECYGEEASKKNRELVEGKEVRLEKDVSETDKYGRTLRYLWIGDTLINELLVREGYAQSSSYPPDVKYQDRFRQAEKLAREEGKGMWGDVCITPTPKPTNTPIPTKKVYVPTPTTYIPPTSAPAIYIAPTTVPHVPPPTTSTFTCNCSKTCPNMSSCEEAYFQLIDCGCKVRDGDSDGIPCESICL